MENRGWKMEKEKRRLVRYSLSRERERVSQQKFNLFKDREKPYPYIFPQSSSY